MMKKPGVLVIGSALFLVIAGILDRWHAHLAAAFQENFDTGLMLLRLWSLPISSALLFSAGGFFLFCRQRSPSRPAAIFNLILGTVVLLLPGLAVSFHFVVDLARIGIDINYFGKGLLFYAAAFLAAAGLVGLVQSQPLDFQENAG